MDAVPGLPRAAKSKWEWCMRRMDRWRGLWHAHRAVRGGHCGAGGDEAAMAGHTLLRNWPCWPHDMTARGRPTLHALQLARTVVLPFLTGEPKGGAPLLLRCGSCYGLFQVLQLACKRLYLTLQMRALIVAIQRRELYTLDDVQNRLWTGDMSACVGIFISSQPS
jgi:hypothetical protein